MTAASAATVAKSVRPRPRPSMDEGVCSSYGIDGGRLSRARARALPTEVESDLAGWFGALAHPARVRILHALRDGELCVCELADLVGLSISATSRQLASLRARGAVDYRTEGRFSHYRLADPALGGVLDLALARVNGEGWP